MEDYMTPMAMKEVKKKAKNEIAVYLKKWSFLTIFIICAKFAFLYTTGITVQGIAEL